MILSRIFPGLEEGQLLRYTQIMGQPKMVLFLIIVFHCIPAILSVNTTIFPLLPKEAEVCNLFCFVSFAPWYALLSGKRAYYLFSRSFENIFLFVNLLALTAVWCIFVTSWYYILVVIFHIIPAYTLLALFDSAPAPPHVTLLFRRLYSVLVVGCICLLLIAVVFRMLSPSVFPFVKFQILSHTIDGRQFLSERLVTLFVFALKHVWTSWMKPTKYTLVFHQIHFPDAASTAQEVSTLLPQDKKPSGVRVAPVVPDADAVRVFIPS